MTIKVVNDVVDRYAQSAITQQLRVQSLALELERLDELQSVFHSKAMEGDTASGALRVKIAEC